MNLLLPKNDYLECQIRGIQQNEQYNFLGALFKTDARRSETIDLFIWPYQGNMQGNNYLFLFLSCSSFRDFCSRGFLCLLYFRPGRS